MPKKENETEKHPGGRPSKYKPEYCQAMIAFFSVAPNRKEVTAKIKGYGKAGNQNFDKEEYKRIPNSLPTFAKFARKIAVNRDTIVSEWIKKHEEFSDAYNVCKDLQKEFLMENGLAGLYPPASYIFTAKNITDMRDKQEVDTTKTFDITGLEKLEDNQLDELIKALQTRASNRID